MFDNIGGKIKTLAQVVCWIGIIASIIIGFVMMAQDDDTIFTGILIMIFGSLGSWLGSFMTYGFGQLVENSDILVNQCNKMPENHNDANGNSTSSIEIKKEIADKLETLNKWKEQGLITEEEYQQKVESLK